jgi:small-conductance mechanosensitive channel
MRAFVLLLLILALAAPLAQAQTPANAPAAAHPAAPTLTPAQAQGVLDVLQDDKKRQAFIAVLENMVHAMPAAPAAKPSLVQVASNSLGARLVLQVSHGVEQIAGQFGAAIAAVNDAPLLWSWAIGIAQDPTASGRVLAAFWRLAVVLACAGTGEWLVSRLLARPQRMLEARAPADETDQHDVPDPGLTAANAGSATDPHPDPANPQDHVDLASRARGHRFSVAWKMLRRLPYVAVALLLRLMPVAVFAALGNALLGTPLGDTENTRLVVIAVVNAYVICRVVMCLTRAVVAPDAPRLRLVMCDDDTAAYIERWMRRLAAVAVFGFAAAEVGLLFGLYNAAHDVVIKLVGLTVHIMLIVIVLQKRHAVEHRLRARRRKTGMVANFQNQLAAQWHVIAIFYIVALWLVAAAEIKDGYTKLLHFFLVTSAVIIGARLVGIVLLGGLDRGLHAMSHAMPGLEPRINRYYPVLRATLSAILLAGTGLTLLEVWGFSPLDWFAAGNLGDQVLSALLTSGVTVAIAAAIWEAANVSVENHLADLTRQAQMARAARLRTLLPMLRTALLVSILIIAGLIVLSQVGVNIAPLLAGAGVLGVALGFGSQKLVQDLITGLFLLLENTMQVGDVITLAGLTGTVEYLSIRTIRLRALDGSMHIIPFSSVTTVTNLTRDFSYALVDLPVGLNEEPDQIADVLRDIVRTMRAEPRWQDAITADLDVMGVNAFGDNAWTLRLRIRTAPAQRWAVNREFNRRVKYRFDELGIQSPLTAWRAQGWLPPGAERPILPPAPESPAPPVEPDPGPLHESAAAHDPAIAQEATR